MTSPDQDGGSTEFTMRVGLGVLDSLGINLYSNAAAVLTEIVANAWDADSNSISIDWVKGSDTITIEDDGAGMSFADLNAKFLTVGYRKRETDGLRSPKFDREYMGRKGIGKLSVFSLANEVDVYSRVAGGDIEAFSIDLLRLQASVKSESPYHPRRIIYSGPFPASGTRLVLSRLNLKRLDITIKALRKRLARRFDVFQGLSKAPDGFAILINGDPIGVDDREDLQRLEYIWTLGESSFTAAETPAVKRRWTLDGTVDAARGWSLKGWFGSVRTPKDLQVDDDPEQSLRNIIIMARKRPIQEGILDQLNFNKLFGSYVTGQISAEFLDSDDLEDIATSDRQRLMEDDERVVLLRHRLRELFLEAEAQWSEERPKQKFIDLTKNYPLVHEWATSREANQRPAATKLIETIASITMDSESSRRELFRAGILGFERIALEATTDELGKFAAGLTADDILPLLANQRGYEDALYIQILRSRIAAIEQLERLIAVDEKERALQQHLFDNMWLLDPSWEHATADAAMEISLRRVRKGLFDVDAESKLRQGRIDIKYRAAAGTHMIVELKRYGIESKLDELYEQGEKYWSALKETLLVNGTPSDQIAVVFVLGRAVNVGPKGKQTEEERIGTQLAAINGRILYYDTLLNNAKRQYATYADAMDKTTELSKILESLDVDAPSRADDEPPTLDLDAPPIDEKPDRPSPADLAKLRRPATQ